jgi:DNA helicase IV
MHDSIIWVLYYILVIIGIISLYQKYPEWKKTRQEKKERTRLFLIKTVQLAQQANREFDILTSVETGFFSNHSLMQWKETFSQLWSDMDLPSLAAARRNNEVLKQFINTYDNASHLRQEFNARFVQAELSNYATFFDNIEQRKLDEQQRRAVVCDEDNALVIAGAGSGKTTTIVGKVSYIIHRYKVNPNEILLISFTRKSAADLVKRINTPGINAKTFHRFGMDVITEVENKQPSIYDPDQFTTFIQKTFASLCQSEGYLKQVTDHFINFSRIERDADSFDDQGQYFQYLQDQKFESYKTNQVTRNNRTTYKREVVKSIEECKIANFLFFNNIDYEYELPYEHDTATKAHRQYHPDFTLNPKGKRVYLEHFGINKSGRVAKWLAKEGQTQEMATKSYQDGIEEKRKIHHKYETTLIETYSYEMADDTLYTNLSQRLARHGISLAPKSPHEKWQIINEVAEDEVDNVITLFASFITLLKANNYSIEEVLKRNARISNQAIKDHNASFLRIVTPIYEKYQQHLVDRKEIDLNDAIHLAATYVRDQRYQRKFRYIIIDEFQDISIGRYRLVQALKQSNPSSKLFAVGDDWQSIYRFTGSDISLFRDFENYFGYTIKSRIETTYRFKDPLISITSNFILRNPNQEKKTLRAADKTKTTNLRILYSESERPDDTLALKKILDELVETDKNVASKTILILGRYTFDLQRIRNEEGFFTVHRTSGLVTYKTNNAEITAQFLTVHKSKGLEGDIVIVINCNSGTHGFPTEISDDPVLNLLLSNADRFENSEERRLFYVAMTRAKESLFLITAKFYKSKFILELEKGSQSSPTKTCPRCKTAELRLKSGTTNGKPWSFYGCSNYVYGCDYQEWVK